ncbi:MAG: alpha/beta family hydrolase [Gemmatimonadales bacterium]
MTDEEIKFDSGTKLGPVSGILHRPRDAGLLYVFAHGGGADMRHPFMERMSVELASRGVATLRYQFPYKEAGKRRPDYPSVLKLTVQSAIGEAQRLAPDLQLIAGGKSLGGRMTSAAASEGRLPAVRGVAFLGFPLHPSNDPGVERAEHLHRVRIPMLFLQGTRDAFARIDLIRTVVADLGSDSTIHIVDEGDHSFNVPKRSGRTHDEVLRELAETIRAWAESL